MAIYAVAIGFNIADGSLVPLVPQPSSVGPVPGRREYPAGGGVYEDTHHINLIWDVLETGAMYRALLVQLGLNNADTSNVTLRARDDNFLDWRINAVLYRPEHGRELTWQMPRPRRLVILARDLEEAT